MPNLTAANNPLTENGEFILSGLIPGKEYLLTLKGEFDGATVTLTTQSSADLSVFDPVTDGAWTADAEDRVVMPSSQACFTVTDADTATAIRLTFVPIS
jgi:hypothetical protein